MRVKETAPAKGMNTGAALRLCRTGQAQHEGTTLDIANRSLGRSLLKRAVGRSDDAALFTHERIVSVNLAGKSHPGTRKIFQSASFSLASR
jgi:hypothetical protein